MVNATSKSSRLIGCYQLQPHVIPLPSTMSIQLTDDDEFIVMANAAFWACTNHEEVVALIRHIDDAKMAASKLRDLALGYGNKEEVSIIVIYLLCGRCSISRYTLSASDGKDKDSPLLHSGTHLKQSGTSKLSRPKTFHGEADLHYSTASLSRIKQATTTNTIEPSIKHNYSKSVKDLSSKPALQAKQQPEAITSHSSDGNLVKTLQDSTPPPEVKKKPLEQKWESDTEDDISKHEQLKASSTGLESNPTTTQTQFKTSENNISKPTSSVCDSLTAHEPQPTLHDLQTLSNNLTSISHDLQSLSHGSSYSNITDQNSTENQSLNESANPTWFASLPPMELGDSCVDDTFGLELGMLTEMMPGSTDDNVVLGKRDVDQGWPTRNKSYTQPQSSTRDTDQEQAKANFNFDELIAGLNNVWMTSIPSLPESNSSTSKQPANTKSMMTREDSFFLDNSTLMEQFDQPVDDDELNNLITQLSDFVNDTS